METAAATSFVAGSSAGSISPIPPSATHLPSCDPSPTDTRWSASGIRSMTRQDAEWLLRPDVQRGLAAVSDAGLAYDILVRPRELPAALATANALPDMRFVIDHIAKPPIASGEIEAWSGLLEPFRSLPHVSCKLSGMITEAGWADWTPSDLKPYVAPDRRYLRHGASDVRLGLAGLPPCRVVRRGQKRAGGGACRPSRRTNGPMSLVVTRSAFTDWTLAERVRPSRQNLPCPSPKGRSRAFLLNPSPRCETCRADVMRSDSPGDPLHHLQPVHSGSVGKGACGSVWYQNAVEAMSSCSGR